MPPKAKGRKLDSRKRRRPRPGDTSLFDSPKKAKIISTRKNHPDPTARPRRGKGKVIGWYEIRGARTTVWVHAASDDDACGTFRVSKFHRKTDENPVPTGRFKRKLETSNYGLLRDGPHHTVEVNWRNEGEVIDELKKRRERTARQRQAREHRKQQTTTEVAA